LIQQLVSKYQPRKIEDFIGLTIPKALMTRFIASPYTAAFLFCGDSGLGKTTFAQAIHAALGGQLYEVASKDCDLEKVTWLREQCAYRPWSGNFNVVVINEADQMSPAAQLAFLSVLDSTSMPAESLWFFTCNETTKLQGRFLSRVKKIEFEPPTVAEIAAHLQMIFDKEKTGKPKPPDFEAIVRDADSNIRTAMNTLENELLAPGYFKPKKRFHVDEAITRIDAPRDNTKGRSMSKRKSPRLYTIGYDGGLTPEKLSAIMNHLGITVVLDCRSVPSSRIKGWHGTALAKFFGTRYQMQGDQLGGRQKGINDAGIEWLAQFITESKETPVLLCKEQSPGACHRFERVAMPLMERFAIDAIHIFDDQLITTAELDASFKEDREPEFETFELAKAS